MKTPELKARELIIKFQFSKPPLQFDKAKQCALICVDEIIVAIKGLEKEFGYNYNESLNFWNEVKTEIEKL